MLFLDTETDTVSTRKTGKKKKKKAVDKDNKQNFDKNERNSLLKISRSDESIVMKSSTATNDRKYTNKQLIKGNTYTILERV